VDGLGDYATAIALHVGFMVRLHPDHGLGGIAWTVARA